ncbi:glycoside hydrolase [Pedobacter changchengzhani]|uniref:Glycoside hydrolase n=1 Tax=Pedobacter changchengzhani TaxID=2529274 RepID=A0A4V3A0D6_9SPHI|nr:glycosyl hydrolase family 28 protein [Pedobacter changchengzhani]TDG36623.1 glycoside hydrolase [Pedobacter changchengzhani]
MKRTLFSITIALIIFNYTSVCAKDYPAAFFGVKNSADVLNTKAIQTGIDYISNHGGGRLVFSSGTYLTGCIHLKSAVTVQLNDGSILLGSTNPLDYDRQNTPFDNGRQSCLALLLGLNQNNVGITGKGTIDGQGAPLVANITAMINQGLIKDPNAKKPGEDNRPMIISLFGCRAVTVQGIALKNSACWVECYNQCKNVMVNGINVNSKAFHNNDGIDIVDCENFTVKNSSFTANDDCICLKSLDSTKSNANILIENNEMHNGASGFKIGTATHGTFRNIKIINNKVYDSYRAAVSLESVDGSTIQNIEINNMTATGVGNGIFIRLGARGGNRPSEIKDVKISNVSIKVGIKQGRENGSAPAILIAGLPGQFVSNISLTHISVATLGGANAATYKMSAKTLTKVPENPKVYPEYDMFGELPSWAIYIRHSKNISFKNVRIASTKKDFRNAVVLDDAHDCVFDDLKLTGPDAIKEPFSYQSSGNKF